MTLYFEPYNGSTTRYVLLPGLPTIGSIVGMIEVEVNLIQHGLAKKIVCFMKMELLLLLKTLTTLVKEYVHIQKSMNS